MPTPAPALLRRLPDGGCGDRAIVLQLLHEWLLRERHDTAALLTATVTIALLADQARKVMLGRPVHAD